MPGESLSLSERVQIEVGVAAGELNETIYRAIYAHGRRGLPAGLSGCLHRRRPHRRQWMRHSHPIAPVGCLMPMGRCYA